MLTAILVERLGVIERAELELGPGSIVLTGETGAGKTLVVSAASLLLGARADRSLVRSGSEDAFVQGRFLIPREHPAAALLEARGVPLSSDADEVEVVVSRSISSDAKGNRTRVNGILTPLNLLAELGSYLVEIAGQNEHTQIGSPTQQRILLDRYAGTESLAERVAVSVQRSRAAAAHAEKLENEERSRVREADSLRHEIEEIQRAEVVEGELEHLEAQVKKLERAAELSGGLDRVEELLRGEGGVEEKLSEAESILGRVADIDPGLHELGERLSSSRVEIGDVAGDVVTAAPEGDPSALDQMRARIGLLRGLRRKYGEDEAAVLAHAARARQRIEELEDADARTAESRHEAEAAAQAAAAAASELTSRRSAAAPELARSVCARLAALAMPEAEFQVEISPCEIYEGGAENVIFKISANPGEQPTALRKVASGGELARIALALGLAATGRHARTMIFDEIDAGVGGAAAAEVGRSLAELAAAGTQVIVVTHLPQVAAFADEHHSVLKEVAGGRTRAVVRRIVGEERVTEVTRMLAGLPESERGRDHARELLELAGSGAPAG